MLEIKKETKPVKIHEVIYELEVPTLGDAEKFNRKENQDDQDYVIKFLEGCGLPNEVIKKLQISQVKEIIEYLTGQKKS